jgi:hypothetical protein
MKTSRGGATEEASDSTSSSSSGMESMSARLTALGGGSTMEIVRSAGREDAAAEGSLTLNSGPIRSGERKPREPGEASSKVAGYGVGGRGGAAVVA